MRAGLSTIQQTLTPEAASVLNQSIAEAARRNHGQTTPLHVAATLLASPTGYLRQACIRSHPNSSHPLQCRALELCFSVALDRLPSAASAGPVSEPPISNALMAALKRAQAHQRRGFPEQQQQPLLAVKVELEQLIVSILDDPSVSRVMREASFSSPAVKATIEQSIASTSSSSATVSSPQTLSSSAGGLGFRSVMAATTTLLPANRSLYFNPRLQQQHPKQQQQQQQPRVEEEVKKVLDVLARSKKRNPVMVGDSELEALMKEVLQRIEKGESVDGPLKNSYVMSLEKEFTLAISQISSKVAELANSIESRLDVGAGGGGGGGVILNLGDLKWLVENSNGIQQQLVPEAGRVVVAEMGKLLARFNDGGNGRGGRVWLMGTATCATYLRCQVYHPSMESDWDLQAVPIASMAPVPGMLPRKGGIGILSNSVESLAPHKGLVPSGVTATTLPSRRPSEKTEPSRRTMCPVCTENYERELAKLVAEEFEKASSNSKPEARQTLPPWLQAAKLNSGNTNSFQTREQELKWKQNTEGLLNRWHETCLRVHPSFHHPVILSERPPRGTLPIQNYYESKILPCGSTQPRLSPVQSFISPLQMNNQLSNAPLPTPLKPDVPPPKSPVRTDLVLGRPITSEASTLEENHEDRIKDLSGCTQDFFPKQQMDRIGGNLDTDSFKRLFRGLTEKIWWQPDAASSIAGTVIQRRSGEGRRRAIRSKAAGTWLLFLGPDKVGKKKMAFALSEILFGTRPTTVRLCGSVGGRRVDFEDGGCSMGFCRKTALDRIAEAAKHNPFSVFVIEDVDQADPLVRGRIKQAIESGRLPDSHGREVSLSSGIFIMTADMLPGNFKDTSMDSLVQCEEKLEAIANSGCQLELLVGEKSGKRRGDWLSKEDRPTKPRTGTGSGLAGLSVDLNLATCLAEEDTEDGSRNSSDLTVEHDLQHSQLALKPQSAALPIDMVDVVDDAIVFKPVDFEPLRRKVSDTMIHKFNSIVGGGQQLQVDAEALERVVAGIWFGDVGVSAFDEWTKNVLLPCFQQLKSNQVLTERSVVRLVPGKDECTLINNRMPSKIMIADAGGGLY